jgi:oxygen-dependent protoporphyrinogen oxidase
VVVGGGITGLAAALRLTQLLPEASITLLEADNRLGGKIVTERVDGFLIEGGPDSFLASKPRGLGLCTELGLADALQGTTPRPHRAYVRRRGRLHELPEGLSGLVPTRLGPLLRSGLLSPAGKLRVALDALLPPRPGTADESVGAFVRRRLGREAYEWLVEPLMAGIYAGDGDLLSLAATFPHLREGERRHGGLIRGVLAAQRGAPTPPTLRRGFLTPIRGLGDLVAAGEERLQSAGAVVVTGAPVHRLERRGRRWLVEHSGGRQLEAEAVILATPAFAAAVLLQPIDAGLAAELAAVPYASSAIVTLAFPADAVPRPLDAHGYVVPRAEGRPALACTWTSAKWAHRAPPGMALLRVFLGRFGQEPP